MTSAVRVVRALAEEDIRQAFAIRMRVFVKEQKVPAEIELDEDDAQAIHLLALVGEKAVGTARIVFHGGRAKIGRMAVLKTYRRGGVGRRLLRRGVAIARRHKPRMIYLNAQVAVIGFYEKLGFKCVGAIFDEAGIPHKKMILKAGRTG